MQKQTDNFGNEYIDLLIHPSGTRIVYKTKSFPIQNQTDPKREIKLICLI